MSLLAKKEESASVSLKKYALPAYIVISALIIIYVVYSIIVGGIYNVGLNNGAQQGYQAAVSQLIEQASKQDCQPVAINLGDTKVEVINVACLQGASSDTPAQEPAPAPADAE